MAFFIELNIYKLQYFKYFYHLIIIFIFFSLSASLVFTYSDVIFIFQLKQNDKAHPKTKNPKKQK